LKVSTYFFQFFKGALVFFTDAKCFHCHKDKNLRANDFYALGVKDLYQTGLAFNTSAEDQPTLTLFEFTVSLN